MRKLILFFTFFISTLSFAQPWKDYINLSFSTQKIDDQTAYLIVNVKIKDGWHIFSKDHDPNKADFVGLPTEVSLHDANGVKFIGKLEESPKPTVIKDEFGTSLEIVNHATFKQKVRITKDNATGTLLIEGQTCKDEVGCLPWEREFKIDLKGYLKDKANAPTVEKADAEQVTTPTVNDLVKANKDSVNLKDDTLKELDTSVNKSEVQKIDKLESNVVKDDAKGSFWLIFLLGIGSGLIALLTPCIFPMIPMTVSFFTNAKKSRRKGIIDAMIYGLSIMVIYVGIGVLLTLLLGKTGLNDLSTNIWMNLIFFAVFVIFAFSFLGAFEIQLPTSWTNSADKKADKGGLVGIFFMAFTLALVSFSCTGPIVGTLIVEASQTGLWGPIIGMLGFSFALAFPFSLFAIFPGWLSSLPQSGGWLNSVKVVLGLMELALAFKFLSGVDLAYHWGILTREIFIAIWIVLFGITGFYLLGKIRFSHDSVTEKLSVTRFMFATVFLIFTVYLIPGMFGAPLKLIDGVAPPRNHSEDNFKFVTGYGNGGGSSIALNDSLSRFTSQMHEVNAGIMVFHDLEVGREYAKIVNKPILLDFTGYACANCRRTESTVWPDDRVRPMLMNDFVIISLYVDDKTPLPKEEQVYSKYLESTKRYKGHNWSEMEIKKYNQFSQPLYIVTDAEGNDYTKPIGYTGDPEVYRSFLQEGLNKFKEKH